MVWILKNSTLEYWLSSYKTPNQYVLISFKWNHFIKNLNLKLGSYQRHGLTH